jgi:hypothetical protein
MTPNSFLLFYVPLLKTLLVAIPSFSRENTHTLNKVKKVLLIKISEY